MTITSKLQKSNIRTDDFYHEEGIFGFCCHDMLTFGSSGATVAAARGRYAWIFSGDHPGGFDDGVDPGGGWNNGQNLILGFSDDPGTPPQTTQIIVPNWYRSADPRGATDRFIYYHFHDLIYNPDDATYPFYLYCEGFIWDGPDEDPNQVHECGLLRSTDMFNWVGYGGTHTKAAILSLSQTESQSFQHIRRLGANNWISLGSIGFYAGGLNGVGWRKVAKWTSTDARTWATNETPLDRAPSTSNFNESFGSPFVISSGGQDYMLMTEYHYTSPGVRDAQYATLVAIDSNYNVILTPTPQRLTAAHAGNFPSLDYLQSVSQYVEDGILHFWTQRGYYSNTENPVEGQAFNCFDYYTAIIDATAAASAAPVGVTAECMYGCVVLSWYDALPNKTYRVYRSTDGSTWGTAIASSITALQYVDTPTVGSLYYYKVVTMLSGTEQTTKYRVVRTYVSNGRALTNRHCTRVFDVGGSTALATVDKGWLDAVVGWLHDNALTDRVLYWADPAFGYTVSSGSNINRVFCLGTTLNPRGGDYVPCTNTGAASTSTTYSSTGLNSLIPGWTNTTNASFGRFDKIDPIRRKIEATFVAVYQKASSATATLMSWGEGNVTFQHNSSGSVTLNIVRSDSITPDDYSVTASRTVGSHTAAHTAIATFDGLNPLVYVDSNVGTAAVNDFGTGIADTYNFDGQRVGTGASSGLVVGSGSSAIRGYIYGLNDVISTDTDTTLAAGSYLFNNNEALFTGATLAFLDLCLSPTQVKNFSSFMALRTSGASYSLPSYSTPFVKNVKTDYSAVGDGSADDADNFVAFRTAALAWQTTPNTGLCVLQVPAGSYKFDAAAIVGNTFANGVLKLLVLGEDKDTTILGQFGGVNGFNLGAAHLTNDPTHSARINTVSAGSTTITLTTAHAARISLFSAGKWVFISGIALQIDGFPPNPQQFEWRKISSIASTTITLTEALEYGYKSTWPAFNDGTATGEIDQGGPGTVYQVQDVWDCEHEYRNFSQNQVGANIGTKAAGRFITYKECASVGGSNSCSFFATDNYHFYADNVFQVGPAPAGGMEVDKCIGVATLKGGYHRKIHCQSASPMRLEINGGCILEQLQGTSKRAYLDGFYIITEASLGPTSFGASEKVLMQNGTLMGPITFGASSESDLVGNGYTMASGVLTGPKSRMNAGSMGWVTPGGKCLWRSTSGTVGCFNIVDYAESGSDVVITTDWGGGFPPFASIQAMSHPAPIFTMRGVADKNQDYTHVTYGQCRDLSRVLKPNQPLYSRSRKFHRGSGSDPVAFSNINSAPDFTAFGKIISFVVNVTTAYTGTAGSLLWHIFNVGNIIYPSGAISPFWDPVINLRVAGKRTITTSGVTGTQTGDSGLAIPNLPNPLWIAGPFGETLATNIFTEGTVGPVVEMTVSLDQSPMTMDEMVVTTGVVLMPMGCM